MSYSTLNSRTGFIVETRTYTTNYDTMETQRSIRGEFKPILQLPGMNYGEFSGGLADKTSQCRNYIMKRCLNIPIGDQSYFEKERKFYDPKYRGVTGVLWDERKQKEFQQNDEKHDDIFNPQKSAGSGFWHGKNENFSKKFGMRKSQSATSLPLYPKNWQVGDFVGGTKAGRWCATSREKTLNTFGASATYKSMVI